MSVPDLDFGAQSVILPLERQGRSMAQMLIKSNSWFEIRGLFFFHDFPDPSLMAVRLLSSERTQFSCLSGVQVHPEDWQPEDFVAGWKFSRFPRVFKISRATRSLET